MQSGIEHLCKNPHNMRGKVALLTHPAAVDRLGRHASVLLREKIGHRLVALFGPEHGYYGRGGAGEEIADARHPAWEIPIFSLYGPHRKPAPEMLDGIDTLVVDLQDIGVRCYTFITTLRYAMEACAERGIRVVVCDRPIPLPDAVDGPMPTPEWESFVAGVPFPFVYGMTPGEAALFLRESLDLALDLCVVPMRGWRRHDACRPPSAWISPSPGIRYWETAWTYPITVFTEALPALECGRGGTMPFQLLAAPWMDAERATREINRLELPGLRAAPVWTPTPGFRLCVNNPHRLRPFAATIQILCALQKLYGNEALWNAPGTRPEWFDKLAGDAAIRDALLRGEPASRILTRIEPALRAFRRARKRFLLYA